MTDLEQTIDTSDAAEELSEELLELHSKTVQDKYVKAEITQVEEHDSDEIMLEAKLPNGEEESYTFDKPMPWNASFFFARLAESYGYEPGNIQHLIGDELLVYPDDGEWEIKEPYSTRQFVFSWISYEMTGRLKLMLLAIPILIAVPVALILMMPDSSFGLVLIFLELFVGVLAADARWGNEY